MNLNADDAQRLAEVLLGADPQGPAAADETEPEGRLSPGPFGRYRITRLVGAGGMGEVYEAQQESPARRVAIKVVRPGLLSGEVLRRFEHETRILARLEHPGIAPIFEAGRVDTGAGSLPFFAMEYVDGRPLTEFAAKLPLRARLELFLKVCDAVEHAHRKGVIHRDLKPGNILVDENGRPRVMDFGVARATDSDIRATSMGTELGRLLGTLPYMSPEQVGGDPDALDTRSDVYSLGVVLYELLGGRLPYNLKGEGRGRIPEAVRAIHETEPTPLSSIDRVYRGDLETVVLKALEKERARRYQSVGEFAEDLRRFLASEPIKARPSSSWYQFKKFAKRNRAAVFTAGLLSFGLVLASVVSVATTIEAMRARERAEQGAIAQAASADASRREANRAAAVNRVLVRMLRGAEPAVAMGRDATMLLELLDGAIRDLEHQAAGEPVVEADIRTTIATTYRELGRYDEAIENLTKAMALRRSAGEVSGPGYRETLNELAAVYEATSSLAEAEQLFRELVQRCKADLDTKPEELPTAMTNLGHLLFIKRELEESESLLRAALEHWGIDPAYRYDRAGTQVALAQVIEAMGDTKGAGDLFLGAAGVLRSAPASHAMLSATALEGLAMVKYQLGELPDAELLIREAMSVLGGFLPADHPKLIVVKSDMALILEARGELVAAESLYRETIAARRKQGDVSRGLSMALNNFAIFLKKKGQLDEARAMYEEALQIDTKIFGRMHPYVGLTHLNLGSLHVARQDLAAAEDVYRQGLEIWRETLPPGHRDIGLMLRSLAWVLMQRENFAEAEPMIRECLPILEGSQVEWWLVPYTRAMLGVCVSHRAGDNKATLAEAEETLQSAFEALSDRSNGSPAPASRRGQVAQWLVDLYTKLGRQDDAARYAAMLPELTGKVRPAPATK